MSRWQTGRRWRAWVHYVFKKTHKALCDLRSSSSIHGAYGKIGQMLNALITVVWVQCFHCFWFHDGQTAPVRCSIFRFIKAMLRFRLRFFWLAIKCTKFSHWRGLKCIILILTGSPVQSLRRCLEHCKGLLALIWWLFKGRIFCKILFFFFKWFSNFKKKHRRLFYLHQLLENVC